MEQKQQRPIILEIEDAKEELVRCVNHIMQNRRLPCYLIEPMFAEIYRQIKANAQNELDMARANELKTQTEKGAE